MLIEGEKGRNPGERDRRQAGDEHPRDEERETALRALVERARDGDKGAQEALVKRYERRVYGLILRFVANREDARDILQETMVKALTSLHRYDPEYSLVTWLFRIAANKSIDFLRRRKIELRTFAYEDEVTMEGIPGELTADEAILQKLDWEVLERCMERLDPRYRAVLFLRYKDGLSYKEISRVLSVPIGTVKTLLHRGREELKRLVRKEVGTDGGQSP